MNRHNWAYFLREGIQGIFSHGFMSFASVSVMVTCFVLTGTLTLLISSLNLTIDSISQMGDIRAFVEESYTDEEALALESKLRNIENVSGVDFIDKARGLEELKAQYGDDAWLLDGLEHDNPIRHCYHVWVTDIENYEETINSIENTRGIASVSDSLDAIKRLLDIRQMLAAVSAGFILLLGMVAIFIISNTIKLATFDRRQEISIMKMIGATDGFVRAPFIIESLVLSQFAAGIAFLLQWGAYRYIISTGLSSIEFIKIMDFESYMFYFLGAFMVSAFVFGVVGSLISIRKFLKV